MQLSKCVLSLRNMKTRVAFAFTPGRAVQQHDICPLHAGTSRVRPRLRGRTRQRPVSHAQAFRRQIRALMTLPGTGLDRLSRAQSPEPYRTFKQHGGAAVSSAWMRSKPLPARDAALLAVSAATSHTMDAGANA